MELPLFFQIIIGATALLTAAAGCWYYSMKFNEEKDKLFGGDGTLRV